jgi:VWFA-related protein
VTPAAGLVAVLLAQAGPPQFPSGIELVTLDAVVVDAKGRPVTDLAREEFVVKEDGRAQEVVSFERFGGPLPPPAVDAAPAAAAVAAAPAREGGLFALVVDDQGMGPQDAAVARAALARFASGALQDGDRVLLAATSGAAWWAATMPEGRDDLLAVIERIKGRDPDASRLLDYMSDYEAFVIHDRDDASAVARVVERWTASGVCVVAQGRPDPGCPSRVRGSAAALDASRKARTRGLLATVRRAFDGLGQARGRKSVLLFSRGYLEDSDQSGREVAAAARLANAAVYFFDARGLRAQPGTQGAADAGPANPFTAGRMAFESGVLESAGAEALADRTGGQSFRNTNDLGAAAVRIAAESRAYYLLGIRASAEKKGWRDLELTVTRPGLTVRARKGYTVRASDGTGAATGEGGATALASALDSAAGAAGIPLRATAFVSTPAGKGLTRVLVVAEFDARALRFEAAGDARAARLVVGMALTHRDTGRVLEYDQQVEVRAAEGQDAGWRSVAREFELPAGVAQARVVVLESRGGSMGAGSNRIEVPDPAALRVSTPIVSDRVQGKAGESRAAITLARAFRPAGALFCDFEVLGARPDPSLHAPRVSAGLTVRRAGGPVVLDAPPTSIVPDARGRLVRLIGFTVDGGAPGEYELVLDVRDEVAGARIRRAEPFSLRAAPD